jgi:hypothetical protein
MDCMDTTRRAVPLALLAALACSAWPLQAAPMGWVMNTNQSIEWVDLATNIDTPAGSSFFPSDSLAVSPTNILYAADPVGVLWDVTGPPIPVGPTQRTQIADLDWAAGGLWGYSNGSQELFFFDLGSSSVTYAAPLTLPASLSAATVVTGVAYQSASGDVFLSAYDGPNNDLLLRVPQSSSTALLVGSLLHGDNFSHVSDIDFDPTGTLVAMTWFHRWFYSVNPATAATGFISAGPHRDSTGLALSPVPEPAAAWLFGLGLAGLAVWRRRLS